MAGFTGIPNIPTEGLTDWQSQVFNAIKENVEILTGTRGADLTSKAIIKGSIRVSSVSNQDMQQVSAVGKTWSGISGLPAGESVADGTDFVSLAKDVQTLANDVAVNRLALNTLIGQLKG
jgi:hypothetical protein